MKRFLYKVAFAALTINAIIAIAQLLVLTVDQIRGLPGNAPPELVGRIALAGAFLGYVSWGFFTRRER